MTHRVSTTISTADPVAVAHRAGIPPVDRAGSGQRAAVSTRAIGAVRRTGRFPVYAVAVTDQEGVWQWYRSRDPEKARCRAWRYAEALVRCGGARVLPVTVIEAGRPSSRRDVTGAAS